MSHYLLGIDLGTSSVKVALVDANTLRILANADAEYPIYHPQPGYAVQNPDEWWQATVQATRQVLSKIDQTNVIAIGLSGQMHGMVCLDNAMQVIPDATIIWADRRAEKQAQDLLQRQHQSKSQMPGFPATGFAASSALWLKENTPHILEQTAKWCLPKDYLRLMLTGNIATEPSDAASTWLYDVTKQAWAEDICTYCGLTPEQMPQIIASHEVSGLLTQGSANELGLPVNIPVVGGSADLPAQALGYGISSPDKLLITVGSGGQVFVPTSKPVIITDQPYYVFNHNVADTWYIQTSILTAGLSMRWLRDFLGLSSHDNAYAHLSSLAESTKAGADGLLFLPYLAGERNPNPDANAQGLIHGLKLNHQPEHFARAIMEGVGFALKESLSHIPYSASIYLLSGGITKSPVWCQILSDILEHPLETPTKELPYGCLGVAILAGVGVGYLKSIDDSIQLLSSTEKKTYYPGASQFYGASYQQYLRLYRYMKRGSY